MKIAVFRFRSRFNGRMELWFSWRNDLSPASRLFGILAIALGLTIAGPSHAGGKPLPSCWVEFHFSPPVREYVRTHWKRPPLIQILNRYAVVINPKTPDYRFGFTVDKRYAFLFRASCAQSKEAIDHLIRRIKGWTEPIRIKSVIVRPPKPSDIRLTNFFLERPKYWLRDCTVAIGFAPQPPGKARHHDDFFNFLMTFTKSRPDIFASNLWSADYENSRIIIEFWHACERRLEMAQILLDAYGRHYRDAERYKVLHENIDPDEYDNSKSALHVWLDHYFPDGPPKK